MKLIKEIEDKLTLQDYSKTKIIDGVKVVDLKRFNDDGGSFIELARLTNGNPELLPEVNIKQINFSEMLPNVIKAFHVHIKQTDIWFVPPKDKILLVLVDIREDSPTKGLQMRIPLGDYKSKLVVIPPGIAHGCKNIGTDTGQIIYFVSSIFSADPKDSDEGRLPWDYFGSEIWEIEKG